MDVDPKLQTNRVADLGRTVRPSSRAAGVALLVALAVMSVFGAICAASGHGFDIFALLYILSGQWEFTGAQWALAGLLVILAGALAGLCWWLLGRKVAPKVTGSADRTRVDVYAPSMGHGEAVSKVTRERAEKMASRLVKDYDPKRMEPGYPLGRNIVDGTPMSTSWEDMAIVLAGPRSGKSLCYAIPAVCSAPGPCLATSNKGDILDVTRPVRMHDHPDGRIWVFDPERIAEPNRKHTTWVWNLIDSIHTIADAKRIADCWRYASGQPSTGGDDFFPGTAAQQLADYLFAAHLGGKTVADVLDMPIEEAATFFKAYPSISRYLDTLVQVGLGYIRLGQPAPTLSGGESQRVKLATELQRRSTGKTVYILDEPTTGLHFEDVRKLLLVLQGLVDKGNTVIVIEHNLDVVKSADWIIDLGPEGGDGGGTIVTQGTPEQVAQCEASWTGKFLKDML